MSIAYNFIYHIVLCVLIFMPLSFEPLLTHFNFVSFSLTFPYFLLSFRSILTFHLYFYLSKYPSNLLSKLQNCISVFSMHDFKFSFSCNETFCQTDKNICQFSLVAWLHFLYSSHKTRQLTNIFANFIWGHDYNFFKFMLILLSVLDDNLSLIRIHLKLVRQNSLNSSNFPKPE